MKTTNFAHTELLPTLWVGAFVSALSLHIALGIKFYFQSVDISDDVHPPAIMLTFAHEVVHSAIDAALPDVDIDSEVPPFSFLKPEFSRSVLNEVQGEKSQSIEEKSDFIAPTPLKKFFSSKTERGAFVKQPSPTLKTTAKNENTKRGRLSATFATDNGNGTAVFAGSSPMQWLAKVQAQLERQKGYLARQRIGLAKGVVQLEFKVHEQGDIFSSRVAVSSGDHELDQLAITALQRVGIFPPPPVSKANKIIRVSLIFN
ncbi:TonB protein [Bartonella australis AUST/NH1]|uniref:TonB protein n=1 Tax=Bartonella australis (strain Aust/NH1) TaxID=1094489 RepID=M1PCG6_BARAA|nr:TonB family protein [Bartonella australis]AGF74306.1 TonB protein [Bartonella australis AUST/NH1]